MLIACFIVLLFVFSLVSGRLEKTVVTPPIVFAIAGSGMAMAMGPRSGGGNLHGFLTLAEIGLVLLLFTDASRTDLKVLRSIRELPVRLLSIGLLLSIAMGAALAKLVFPSLSIWEAGIIGAILAPTDAGLGQIIVNSPKVPVKIRQALNVEAGLNDGLCVPFLLFFMAMAGIGGSGGGFMRFIGEQLGIGLVVGGGIGLLGGWMIAVAGKRKWMSESYLQIAVVALPVCCLLLSEHVGASMFIAAFVAGLAVQVPFRDAGRHSVEFTEEWGQILNLSVFFLFGLLATGREGHFTTGAVLYAILSLTVVRMLPVALALAGTGLDRRAVVFIGWFGPRGLASIVLGLVYLAEAGNLPGEETTRLAVTATVFLSIFAHGLSANSGIRLLAKSTKPPAL
jgi:NhaP-type Na+/H+ or K+/H+ antiporter